VNTGQVNGIGTRQYLAIEISPPDDHDFILVPGRRQRGIAKGANEYAYDKDLVSPRMGQDPAQGPAQVRLPGSIYSKLANSHDP